MSMSNPFNPDRSLLDPKFEGYKLEALSQEECVVSYDLPEPGATQSTVSGRSSLSFKEVQSRIGYNHLVPSKGGLGVAYIDKTGHVILGTIDENTFLPTFHDLFQIPESIQSASSSTNTPSEYPGIISLDDKGNWLVSDGSGRLYLLQAEKESENSSSWIGNLRASYEVTPKVFATADDSTFSPDDELLPLRLYAAQIISDAGGDGIQRIRAIVSTKIISSTPGDPHPKTKIRSAHKIQFRISSLLLEIPSSSSTPNEQVDVYTPRPVSVGWSLKGDDLPVHVSYDSIRQMYLILAESGYTNVLSTTLDPSIPPPPPDPQPDEIAPIPRAGENLDGPDPASAAASPPKTPPYTWTQTNDSLTIAFFLPATLTKGHIRITLTAKSLSLLVLNPAGIIDTSAFRIPKYAKKEWWDGIDASASFWTWEKEGETRKGEGGSSDAAKTHTVGVLTLYLEKQHEGTRWSHVFASSGTGTKKATGGPNTEEDEEEDVPETMDPSELYAAREALEKYTAALVTGEDASGLGLGSGVPSLAQREEDEELDTQVGRRVIQTWVTVLDGGVDHLNGWPADLLAVPIPQSQSHSRAQGAGGSSSLEEDGLVIKSDIDGLLYAVDDREPNTDGGIKWTHRMTYSALAFVLASKRDTRFTFHHGAKAVMAFESGSGGSVGGNVYVYRSAGKKEQKWAKQAVLKVGGGTAGTLLGVVAVTNERGESRVICLCERELVVLRDVI